MHCTQAAPAEAWWGFSYNHVSHINRRTQFENPVLEAKRKLQQHNMPHTELGTKPLQAPGFRVDSSSSTVPRPKPARPLAARERSRSVSDLSYYGSHLPWRPWRIVEKPLFTRDASQLKGTFLSTTLKKSNMGFGFTIIGGDEPDEFLQVKSVIPDGPAAQDGKMETENNKKSSLKRMAGNGINSRDFQIAFAKKQDKKVNMFLDIENKDVIVYFVYIEYTGFMSRIRNGRGDVIVYINEVCVLGHTHADVVKLFQSVPIGQSVNLVLCRGYPLPFDPEDPANSMVPPLAIMERPPPVMVNGRHNYETYLEYISRTSQSVPDITDRPPHTLHSMPADGQLDGTYPPPVHDDNVSMASSGATQAELMTLTIVKGAQGFGFTIADSPTGQRVKQILDIQGCPGLCEGDLIIEINQQNVQNLSHTEVVDILKDCPIGSETSLIIHRGGFFSPWKTPKPIMDRWENQGSPQTSLSAPAIPQNLPFPPALHRSSFPDSTEAFDPRKPDPYELYEKSRAIYESRRPDYKELDVHLRRMESGFGFRILGGDEPGQPILIGAVIAMGSADRDGRLHPGDELVYVDGIPVAGKTHRYVIDLMHHAARNGQVNLTVRRKVLCGGEPCPENGRSPGSVSTHHSSPRSDYATYTNTYSNSNHAVPTSNASPPEGFASHSLQTSDVVIHRKENEGFGFVIISSLNRPESGSTITVPHKIGRIIDGSPADRCAKLKVGDRILAVNGQSIINMPHADIVKLIKDAGLSVTLRIIPQEAHVLPSSSVNSLSPDGNDKGKDPSTGHTRQLNENQKVGDQIIEINGESTRDMTHARAIELIKSGGRRVRLLLKRGTGQVPEYDLKRHKIQSQMIVKGSLSESRGDFTS
ncbi:hypothetical protein JEQ12_015441 [Ovis aries]|uniref:PDZ domain-containing protein n=1 Tax=Ovis aries TaxID=9940 RepID=A0A836D2A5_SHEEP|nr:hypothetical protein JEQ12_015441 [Ovis aries]